MNLSVTRTISKCIGILWIVATVYACSSPLQCLPDAMQWCLCKHGSMGLEVCDSKGKIVSECVCNKDAGVTHMTMDAADTGLSLQPNATMHPGQTTSPVYVDDVPVDAGMADAAKRPDVQTVDAGPRCGNERCDGSETCMTCSSDCGQCPPVCGDAQCNGAETCMSCPGDCGTCPSRCGDAQCNGGETCGSCPSDCHACACQICTSDADCAAELYCGAPRSCDGKRGCTLRTGGTVCMEISGQACPATTAYHFCDSKTVCSPNEICDTAHGPITNQCHPNCKTDTDCPVPSDSSNTLPKCILSSCYLSCMASTVCPPPTTCRLKDLARYLGYCAPQ